jgi:GH18 family chitinase
MTYDYHGNLRNKFDVFFYFWFIGAWDNVTGINAPLYGQRYGGGDKRWNVVSIDERSK